MSQPYYAIVTVIGTTDVKSVITELEAYQQARWDAATESERRDIPRKLSQVCAAEPWTFEDKSAVRFTYMGRNTNGLETMQAFSARHPSWFVDVTWEEGDGGWEHGESFFHNGEVWGLSGRGRTETDKDYFLDPDPTFFVDSLDFSLPQRFRYRLQHIAWQLESAAACLTWCGELRDMGAMGTAHQALIDLAAVAASVVANLNLKDVLVD